MSIKLHAVTDANSRLISVFKWQTGDCACTAALPDELPQTKWLMVDCGYNAGWFRAALQAKGISGRKPWNKTVKYDKRRSSIEAM